MSFLDEVDSLKAKLGIGKINPLALVGVCIALCAVALAVGLTLWGSFTQPGIVVERQDNAAEDGGESISETVLCVHVVGEVAHPGMYELKSGARVSDAIEAAGGMLEDADQLSVNLARSVSDGEQIVVAAVVANEGNAPSSQETPSSNSSSDRSSSVSGKVNINTANVSELTSLDGIGQATAEKIVAYRQANGSFPTIDAIKNVSGIGDKKFEAIKDRITV